MFLKNCLQQWDNVTGVTGYDITIYEQLLTDVGIFNLGHVSFAPFILDQLTSSYVVKIPTCCLGK